MKDEDVLFWLFAVLVGAGLFFFGLAVWAVVSFFLATIIAYLQYKKYLREARKDFDESARELGVDLPVVDILESIGIEVPEEGGFETVAAWMTGAPLGVSEEWED